VKDINLEFVLFQRLSSGGHQPKLLQPSERAASVTPRNIMDYIYRYLYDPSTVRNSDANLIMKVFSVLFSVNQFIPNRHLSDDG